MTARLDIWVGEVLWLIDRYHQLIEQGGNIKDLHRYNDRLNELEELLHDMKIDDNEE